jgi:hypothetical protein
MKSRNWGGLNKINTQTEKVAASITEEKILEEIK